MDMGEQRRIDTHLGRLVQGFRLRDCAWLVRYQELLTNIYLIDYDVPAESYGFHPEQKDIPWPVVPALGSYSKKHIFEPTTPKLSTIAENFETLPTG